MSMKIQIVDKKDKFSLSALSISMLPNAKTKTVPVSKIETSLIFKPQAFQKELKTIT
jgi:hypothetical protein